MSLNKEKLLNRINQDIENAEEAIRLVLRSKNYHVAGNLKNTTDYLRGLAWAIEDGHYDQQSGETAIESTEPPSEAEAE